MSIVLNSVAGGLVFAALLVVIDRPEPNQARKIERANPVAYCIRDEFFGAVPCREVFEEIEV